MLLPVAVNEELHSLRSIRWAGGVGLANWDPKALTLVIVFGPPRDPQNSSSLKKILWKIWMILDDFGIFFLALRNEI